MSETNNEKKKTFVELGRNKNKSDLSNELIVPIILMSTIGAFYWAIRGSAGYGGTSGGLFAGIGWALAWYFLSHKVDAKSPRPFSSGWIVFTIVLGIGIGGMHGYGQFMSWIQGKFYLDYPTSWTAINPAIGYLWLFQCGLTWGGITGLFMGYCGSKRPLRFRDWMLRFVFGITGIFIALSIAIFKPEWINPLFDQINYGACPDCTRTLSTSLNAMIWIGLFLGLLSYEVFRREWRNVMLALVMGLGFALAFSIFAFWHFGPNFSTLPIDWWKNWEMSIGFCGGATFGICFYLFNRPFKNSELKNANIQPDSHHRTTEKIIGVDLAIFIALGWSIYNGIGGFVENFSLNQSLTLLIALPLISIILIYFVIVTYKTINNSHGKNDEKINTRIPALKFLIVHIILIILGYLVSMNPRMAFANWFLIFIYSILLIISGITFFIRIKSSKIQ